MILFPDRVLADDRMPLIWRVYGELQKAGANTRWLEPHPARLAAALGRHRRSVGHAIAQLAAAGYLARRPRPTHARRGAVTVYEVRLLMGTGAALRDTLAPGKVDPGET